MHLRQRRIMSAVARATHRADVAVLGGGIAGLAAALALARSGRRVVVIERDEPPRGDDADGLFELWDRRGIAHFRQPHNFLGLARQVLLEHAPDVLDAVLALGATEHRQYQLLPGETHADDEAFVSICARRPVFEAALRRAVDAEPGIDVRSNISVVGLVGARRRDDGAIRITGARTADGGEIAADLFVDALGRTSKVLPWLLDLGARPPLERRSECGLLYYSRHFRFLPGVEVPKLPALLRGPRAEIGFMAFAVFVEDNRTFCPVLTIPPWDRELRALKSEAGYMAAALSMPALVPWVHPDQSKPITRVLPMGSLQNLHRSLVVDGKPVAVGIEPVGDALCHTNPTFAYGASLSIHHGFTLAGVADRTDDPKAIALGFDDAVGADTAVRFDAVSAEDRDRLRLWGGEAIDVRDPRDSMALFLRLTAYPAGARDAELFRAVARRVNLLDPADALQRDHALIERAERIGREEGPQPPMGPTRAELLELVQRGLPSSSVAVES